METLEAQFLRVIPRQALAVRLTIDGQIVEAIEGDSLLAVLLLNGGLRRLEFGGAPRAGFCLMGACQDCWVWSAAGDRSGPARPSQR